jgi:predicted Rossmann fold flavoprotein
MISYDLIVIGGGAAGLFCAATAGRRGKRVLLLEANERIGKKILISGGGRCNFTNLNASPDNYLSDNPDYCKSALARFSPEDFVAYVEKHRIPYHEKKLGQLFCDESSKHIVEMLQTECLEAKVMLTTEARVKAVTWNHGFTVTTENNTYFGTALVVAAGGLSLPKLGANDFAYRLAEQFGHRLTDLRAGLVPFTLDGEALALSHELSGVALPCRATAQGRTFEENFLLTHRGLSGPAILQISSYWKPGTPIQLNLFPHDSPRDWILEERQRDIHLANFLGPRLTNRFAQKWAGPWADRPLRSLTNPELETLITRLTQWSLTPSGTEGYATAEVTCGGIDTRDLSSKTMESRKQPGLYFIGECVDVTGWLGGYNFQWAWASANAAGMAV